VKNSILYLLFFSIFLASQASGQSHTAPKPKKEKLILEFSTPGGLYESGQTIELRCPGAKIFYTLDGSTPDGYSRPYRKPLKISKTTVLRAIAYKNKLKTKPIGHTYFIDEPASTLPIVSVAITPSVLFDAETGLYMQGPDAVDSLWTKDGANFWSKREVKVNTEIFETDGKIEFRSVTGFRLFGGMSRLFPQKSITLIARDRYGKKHFKHRIFGKDGFKKYKFLVLRNSGSDWGKSHFRDGLMTGLLDDWDIEKQNFRPAHVYLNGKYWGIYNIREKVNRYFIQSHAEVDKDSLDLIEHRRTTKRGSRQHYLNMVRFIEKRDLSDPINYAYLQTQMDVDNFMDYQIAQIYFDNRDAGGNIKFWRPQTESGRWRWILYDTDWGFGLHDKKAYKNNSLEFYTEAEGPAWPNPPWSTLILRKLLENPDFEKEFIRRFTDRLNTSFTQEQVLNKIDEIYQTIEPEMDRHLDRWRLSERRWQEHVERLKTFASKRVKYMRYHLSEFFETGELVSVSILTNNGGQVILNNNVNIRKKDFTGFYFENIPISLKAMPDFGYRFSHWEGILEGAEKHAVEISLTGKDIHKISAVFEKYVHPLAGQIMINEVSCNNKKTGDWVEVYNDSRETVNLKDWYFTDKKRYFNIPNAKIRSKSYLIICEDSIAFREHFPKIENVVGNFGFGLGKRREKIGLFDGHGASIDSVAYEVPPTDSAFTIGLLLPFLDNGDFDNWEINPGKGTPNRPNPYYLESSIKAEQELWMRIGVGIGVFICGLLLLMMRQKRNRYSEVS